MKKIVLMGECMIELIQSEQGTTGQSFAGDVYNTAVYLKRTFPEHEVHLLTAVGMDKMSDRMVDTFSQERINTRMVFRNYEKNPGIYLVETDALGERSFLYWRENSAARQIMKFIDEEAIEKLCQADMFFFSGISLAVIAPEDRCVFWGMVAKLKEAGVKIIFDPNYRPRLWPHAAEARSQFEFAFEASDILLPGIDDFAQLFDLHEFSEIEEFFTRSKYDELIIKNGPDGVVYNDNVKSQHVDIESVEKVVDTTSAGDSFNGVYVGARMADKDIATSISMASRAAGLVIQYPGAIVPKPAFNRLWESAPMK